MGKFEISKSTSLIIKALAIILMVATHLLGANTDVLISIPLGSTNMAHYLSYLGRMCVYMFAFVSGYGLYYSLSKIDEEPVEVKVKSVFKKIITFLIGYWLILFTLFLPFYISSGSWNTGDFFLSLFGFGSMNIYSWYVYFYIIVLLTLPLLHLLLKKHWSIAPTCIAVLIGTYVVLALLQNKIPVYDKIVNCIFAYISVIIGYAFAKESYLTKIVALFKGKRWIVILLSSFLFVGVFIIYSKWTYGIIMPFLTLLFLIPISLLFTFSVPRWIVTPLELLGKSSMYIWFMHAIVLTDYINKVVILNGSSICQEKLYVLYCLL